MSLGESNVKRAVTWILDQLAEAPEANRSDLIERAAREFDLTPLEEDFLYRQLTDALKRREGGPSGP